MAEAQFNATMQSFNRPYQPPAASPPPQAQAKTTEEEKPSLLTRVAKFIGIGGKGKGTTLAQIPDPGLNQTFRNIRGALARFTSSHNDVVPDNGQIYD